MLKYQWNSLTLTSHGDLDKLKAIVNKVKPEYGAVDTETTGLHIINDKPFVVQFGFLDMPNMRGFTFAVDLENCPIAEEVLSYWDSIAKSLKLYIPYFGYSRQERVSWYNEPVSCEVVAKILDTAKVDAIYTLDIHHDIIQNFFQTPFYNVMTTSLFANYYKKLFKDIKVDYKDVVIVSPDHGSNIRSEALCKELPGSKLVILTKYRPKPNLAEHLQVKYEEVKNKHCVIIDDIIDTGGTIISASNLLMENDAKAVYVAGSHAVFSNRAVENLLNAPIEDIVVTNSIEKRLPRKIRVLDISTLIK